MPYQGTGAKEIETLANYLIRFQDCVHYRKFQSLRLPIGSGEVEEDTGLEVSSSP